MRFIQLIALSATASAASHRIDVGKSGLTFTPDSVTAAVGDTLEFYFVGGTHDAVVGDYGAPCTPSATGERFSSGVQSGSATNVVVNTTEPLYYYCSVGAHCANGMVAAINPAADKTVTALKTSAKGKTAVKPSGVYGGKFETAP
ncbi:Cupredoxin [Lasiosphaeris hirsuta]|uniref:Cupredoxin n=1 Tax=Lasiosphaeris hirsuta TaxID=260670 RepID=A0AA40AIB6_9PEZI|nr:Cupredoxin [Lasiosphaeris hirsuta]